MKKTGAFTIIELLVAFLILTIVTGIMVAIFISGSRIFYQQFVSGDTQSQAKLVTSIVIREIHQADRVLASRVFGSQSYDSSSNTLILEMPSIDSDKNIIGGDFDFKVFFLDPLDTKKLKVTTVAAATSARRSETKTLSDSVSNLAFVYKKGGVEDSPSEADIVTIKVTIALTSYGRVKETSLTGQAKLRNK